MAVSPVPEPKTERNAQILALRALGVRYKWIARAYGISVARVSQVLGRAKRQARGEMLGKR